MAPLITAEGLIKLYRMGEETVHALDGVSFDIPRGGYCATRSLKFGASVSTPYSERPRRPGTAFGSISRTGATVRTAWHWARNSGRKGCYST